MLILDHLLSYWKNSTQTARDMKNGLKLFFQILKNIEKKIYYAFPNYHLPWAAIQTWLPLLLFVKNLLVRPCPKNAFTHTQKFSKVSTSYGKSFNFKVKKHPSWIGWITFKLSFQIHMEVVVHTWYIENKRLRTK